MNNSISIQTQFNLPSNSYKNAFNPFLSPNISFKSKNRVVSMRKTPELPPNNVATNDVYTLSPEQTLYDVLGISHNGTLPEIKRAYKQMALKYHPDVSPPDHVEEYTMKFISVQEAYETLSDPDSRAIYDYNLAMGLHFDFFVKKESRFGAISDKMALWRQSWEVQLEELKRRSMVETKRVGRGERMSWAAQVRKQRSTSNLDS